MTPIPVAVDAILAESAPVFVLDTCNFLDLFRRDVSHMRPKVQANEIAHAVGLLKLVSSQPKEMHLVVPELVPIEYAANANAVEREFAKWIEFHDENVEWLSAVGSSVSAATTTPHPAAALSIHLKARQLADGLLQRAVTLARDQSCLNRAIERLMVKRRPAHKNQIKDSINLEQCLELCRQLRSRGFASPVVFVSSNTNDFAASDQPNPGPGLHIDLQPEFDSLQLEYYSSLRAALGAISGRSLGSSQSSTSLSP